MVPVPPFAPQHIAMPLYDFRCQQGHDFEKFYRAIGGAQSEETCPECGAVASRLMSAAGLVFKGSGFYITDYGKDGKKAEREAATAKDAAKTEAKPAESKSTEAKPAETSSKSADAAPAATAPKQKETKPAAAPSKPAAPAKKAE